MKSNEIFFLFVLLLESKNYEKIKKSCVEYAGNIKMIEISAALLFKHSKKFYKNTKEDEIDELCNHAKNILLHLCATGVVKISYCLRVLFKFNILSTCM